MQILIISLLSILLLSSCSNENENENTTQSNKQHIFSDKKSALDKSKQVEKLIQDGFNKRSQSIDEQVK
jgi:PBP1b-binding outer membrane lipoprotein LpoB